MKKISITSFLTLLLILPLASCSNETITIGTQTYTESKIVGHMYKELIEQETDLNVEVKEDIATSPIVLEGMKNGDIDMSTQYTGTAISSFTEIEKPKDADATIEQAKELFSNDEFQLKVLDPLGWANGYAFTVTEEIADEYDLKKVSDFGDIAGDFSAGFDTSWLERENDGYDAFVEEYEFDFGKTNSMAYGLMYESVKSGDVDVVLAFPTDPQIDQFDLVRLEDDKKFFPPYDTVPVVRQEVLDDHPKIVDAIEPLMGRFDEEMIQKLNGKVDIDEEEIKAVAKEYLEEENLLK